MRVDLAGLVFRMDVEEIFIEQIYNTPHLFPGERDFFIES